MQKHGFIVKKSNYKQFCNSINFLLIGKSNTSIKSEVSVYLKSIPIKHSESNWIWLELKNKNGDPGWIYGAADFIAFQSVKSIFFLKRLDLLQHIFQKVNLSDGPVSSPWLAKYKFYQTPNRLDQICKFNLAIFLDQHPETKSFKIPSYETN